MRYKLLVVTVLVASLAACGGNGGTVSSDTETTVAQDTTPPRDTWPDNLFVGDADTLDLLSDILTDLKDVPNKDTVLTYDTDLVTEGLVTFETQVNPDQLNDGVCVPKCTNSDGSAKECGADGCGDICGFCAQGESKVENQPGAGDCMCKPYCESDCPPSYECGSDGCYGVCGTCNQGYVCNDETRKCLPFCDHDANCEGKECGWDGCAGTNTCGSCPDGKECNWDTGMCEVIPCFGVPEKGKCIDLYTLQECVDNSVVETNCASLGEGLYCKLDNALNKFTCAAGCPPQCTFQDGTPKECGSDGCYGVCGECPSGWFCTAGKCNPTAGAVCAWVPDIGKCFANVLWKCESGILSYFDCTEAFATCAWDQTISQFDCVF